MNPEYGIDCYRSRVRGPYARFCEKDKGPANYWALALLDYEKVKGITMLM